MKSVFLDAEGLENCKLKGLEKVCGQLTMYTHTGPAEAVSRMAGMDVVIINKVKISREMLEAVPSVRLICVVATGTDCVDLEAAKELGVTVCNCRAYGTDSVVQYVFSVILALHTSLLSYHNAVQEGRWQKSRQFCFLDYPIQELHGKTMGIVGYGNLGRGVARMAEAFGMEVVVAARPGSVAEDDRPSLESMLPELDVLTLHCPLTDATRDLINGEMLRLMKPTAFLINAARGGVVNESALLEALINRELGGAAVDVLTVEPPREGNTLLHSGLQNLIVTPHIAWASVEARQRIVDQTIENIESFVAGTAVRRVVG